MKPEDEKTQAEKLEEEITALKTRIKNAEYDLAHMFKGNVMVEKKLEESKKTLAMKEQMLAEVSPSSNDKTNQIHKIEEKIIEDDNPAISKEQEKIEEEELDEEFI